MRIVHLADGRLGEEVARHLVGFEDDVVRVSTLPELAGALADQRADWLVSSGFRHIVPPELLERSAGTVNVHTSLLPFGRGAHPNVWAIVDDEPAGVTLHVMDAGVDTGPIYVQRAVHATFADTGASLHRRLIDAASLLFQEHWPAIRSGRLQPTPQPSGGSEHKVAELRTLADIDPEAQVTWRHALDVLRALTYPPHENVVLETEDGRFHVEVRVRQLGSLSD